MAKIIIEINDELKQEFRKVCVEKRKTQKELLTELILKFTSINLVKSGKERVR